MTSTLATQMLVDAREEKRVAWRDYSVILKRSGAAELGDGTRMREICELLDLTTDDLEADARILLQLPDFQERAKDSADLEKQRARLQAELSTAEQEIAAQVEQSRIRCSAIHRELSGTAHRMSIAAAAKEQTEKLRERGWRVLDGPSPAPEPQGLTGTLHPRAVELWLDPQPPLVAYPHQSGEREVVSALRTAGYEPGAADVWVQKSEAKKSK